MARMKVHITMTVEIDPDDWTLNYGIEGRPAIRADLITWAPEIVRQQLVQSGITVF